MSDYFPNELWPEILKMATPETLLICRCVCKSWKTLISSPSFISSHLSISSQLPCLVARDSPTLPQPSPETYVLIFHPQYSLDSRFTADPHPNPNPNLHIIGTANGLICLTDLDFLGTTTTIVLWNPLIRRSIYPPTPSYSSSTLGFGFDPSTNDIKIVSIARLKSGPKAEVFSLREWKWESIDCDALEDLYFQNRWLQCLFNGAAHWAAACVRSTRNVLLSFRFETEEFRVMELPLELRRTQMSVSKIGSNLLSVFKYEYCTVGSVGADACDIWAMREYGEASSWSKMVRVRWEGGGLRSVMWVSEDCGEVVVSTEGDEVVCYDPWNHKVRELGFRCKGDGCFADGFVGSLCLLDMHKLG